MTGPPEQTATTFLGLFLDKPTIVLTLGVIAFILGATAIIANSCVIVFYMPNYRNVYPMLYVCNCICDGFAGIGAILVGVVLVQLYQEEEADTIIKKESGDVTSSSQGEESQPSTTLIGTIFCIVNIATRVSVICSLTVSVVRVIHIVWIQYKIRYRMVLGAMISVLLFWIAFISAELVLTLKKTGGPRICGIDENEEKKPHRFAPRDGKVPTGPPLHDMMIEQLFLQPFVGKEVLCKLADAINKPLPMALEIFLMEVVPFVIPVFLATFLLILTAHKLLSSSVGQHSEVSRNITVTVFWLTFFYVLCYFPFFVVLCVLGHPDFENPDVTDIVVRFVAGTILPFLSACLLPGTLIVRGSKIKEFYSDKIVNSLQGGKVGQSGRSENKGNSDNMGNIVIENKGNSENTGNIEMENKGNIVIENTGNSDNMGNIVIENKGNSENTGNIEMENKGNIVIENKGTCENMENIVIENKGV